MITHVEIDGFAPFESVAVDVPPFRAPTGGRGRRHQRTAEGAPSSNGGMT
ncbi:hypothetical protein [Microtetraspora sp. NBRC 16547]|nr:hypothetical protein [Microtetraspora sp. NBRC 16547]